MMVLTAFTGSGGLAAHLLRRDTNREVHVRVDLFRGAPEDLHLALRSFVAISQTNLRAKKHFAHVKISPERELQPDQLARTLDLVDLGFGIEKDHPRVVVAHAKGDRPVHYHVVYPHVHPRTGRAISSKASFSKDEAISRAAEIEFVHPFNPGAHRFAAAKRLEEMGLRHYAPWVRMTPNINWRDRQSRAVMQAVSANGSDRYKTEEAAYAAFVSGHLATLQDRLPDGLVLVKGRRAVLLVDFTQGCVLALHRALNAAAKRAGKPVLLRAKEVEEFFPGLPSWGPGQAELLHAETARADRALSAEYRQLGVEAQLDGERSIARSAFEKASRSSRRAERKSLRAQRLAIRAVYRERDRVRRVRVRRAFRAARIVATFRLRRLAFVIAAGGVVMAGGGLGLALVAAGCVAAALPNFERARVMARSAELEQQADRKERSKALAFIPSQQPSSLASIQWEEELSEVSPWYAGRGKGPHSARPTNPDRYKSLTKASERKLRPAVAYRVDSTPDPIAAHSRGPAARWHRVAQVSQNAVPEARRPYPSVWRSQNTRAAACGARSKVATADLRLQRQDSWRFAKFEIRNTGPAHQGGQHLGIND